MGRIDLDGAIRSHTQWRRQFLNAFAGGSYADMPLSEHRSCQLCLNLSADRQLFGGFPDLARLTAADDRFHAIANDIIDLSQNGMADSADLLLPQLTDASHQVVSLLDQLREYLQVSGPAS